jgi:hypothetical protein
MKTQDYAVALGALGYPKFSYLREKNTPDPARLLLDTLDEADLDSRITEGLPWLALTYVDLDWGWLLQNARLRRRQNRLGFVVALAIELAQAMNDNERMEKLRQQSERLELLRLAEEDTFCHDSMTSAERKWLREHRCPTAAHWNILTDITAANLAATVIKG